MSARRITERAYTLPERCRIVASERQMLRNEPEGEIVSAGRRVIRINEPITVLALAPGEA